MTGLKNFFVVLAVSVLSVSALHAAKNKSHGPPSSHSIHWSYAGDGGPAHWGDLNPDYSTCSKGKSQSPIDIKNPVKQDLANPIFHYVPSKINAVNNGHTIQVNYDPGSYIELDGVRYDLVQFHFHAPSEHTINGKPAAAEIHLVHKNSDGQLAVLGILINTGADNAALRKLWDLMPRSTGPEMKHEEMIDATALLPPSKTTYRYDGSLTTPPCTEGVKWNVMTQPIEMSGTQISVYQAIFSGHGTNRPAQPLNKRKIVEDSTP